jgi:hypothetical protein
LEFEAHEMGGSPFEAAIVGILRFCSIARIRGLQTCCRALTWGLRPRLYALRLLRRPKTDFLGKAA